MMVFYALEHRSLWLKRGSRPLQPGCRRSFGNGPALLFGCGATAGGEGGPGPLHHLVGIVEQPLRYAPVGADLDRAPLGLVAERRQPFSLVGGAVGVIHPEI